MLHRNVRRRKIFYYNITDNACSVKLYKTCSFVFNRVLNAHAFSNHFFYVHKMYNIFIFLKWQSIQVHSTISSLHSRTSLIKHTKGSIAVGGFGINLNLWKPLWIGKKLRLSNLTLSRVLYTACADKPIRAFIRTPND